MVKEGGRPPAFRPARPLEMVPWDEVRAECGTELGVVLSFVLGIVVRWLVRSDSGR